jgi:hypothetical protein
MSDNLVIYLIPPRYICKIYNFLFKIVASIFGSWWNFPIFPTLKSLN